MSFELSDVSADLGRSPGSHPQNLYDTMRAPVCKRFVVRFFGMGVDIRNAGRFGQAGRGPLKSHPSERPNSRKDKPR
jgi:hypothetical protein